MGSREIFKENLKFYRKQKGISQEQLSEMMGFGITYITEIESRNKFPKPETIDMIAEKLDIEPYQFFQKLGCPENIRQTSRKDFVLLLSERLYADISKKLPDLISKGISDAFDGK